MMKNYSKHNDDKKNETDVDWNYSIKKDDSGSHILSNAYENIYDSSSSEEEEENVNNKSKADLTEYYLYNEINNHKYNNNIYDFYLNKFNNNIKDENKRNESHNSAYKKNSSFIKNKDSNKGKTDSLKKSNNSNNEFYKNQIEKTHSIEKKYTNSHSTYHSKDKQSDFKNKDPNNTEIVNEEHNKDVCDLPSELVSNNYNNKEGITTIPKGYNINNKKYSDHDTKDGVNIYLNTLINKFDYTISCNMYKKTSATHIYRKRIIMLKKKFLIINKFKQNINNIYKVVNRDIYDISHSRISDIYKSSNNIYKFTIYAKRICIDNISSNSDNSNFFALKKKNAKKKSKDYYKISNDGFHFNNEEIRLANHNLSLITEFINLMKIISIYGSIKKYMKILFLKNTQNSFLRNYGLYYSSPMYFKFLKKYYNSMMHNAYNYIYINILKIKNIEQIKYSYIYAIIDVNDFLYYYKYEYNKDMFIPLFTDQHNKIVFHFYTDLDIYLGYFILYSYEIEKHIYFDLYLNNGKRDTELYNSHMSSGDYKNYQKKKNNNNIYKNSYNDSFLGSTSSNAIENLEFPLDNNKADSKLLNEDSLLNQKNIIFDKNYFFVKKLTNDQKKNAPKNNKYADDSTDDNLYVHIFIYKSKNRFEYLLPQENSGNMLGDNENLSMPNNNLNNNYQLISLFLNNVRRTMQIKNRFNQFLNKLNDIFEFRSFPVSIISLIYIFLCSYFKNYIHIILLLTIIFLISINNEKNYDTYRYLLYQYPILYLFFPHKLLCKISNKSDLYHLHTFVHMFILNKFPIFFQYLYKHYRCKCLYFFAYTPTYFGKYYNSYFFPNEDNNGINKNHISLDRIVKRKYYGKKYFHKHSNKKSNSPDKIEYLESHTFRKKETYENSKHRIFDTMIKGSNHIDYKNNIDSNYTNNYPEFRNIKKNDADNHGKRYYSIPNEEIHTRHHTRRDINGNAKGVRGHSILPFDRYGKNDQYNNNQKYDVLNSLSNKHMNDNQLVNVPRDKNVKADGIDKEKGENAKCKKEEKVNDNILNNLRKYFIGKKDKIINNTKKKSGNNLENEKYSNDMTYLKNNYNYLEGFNNNMDIDNKYNTKFYNKMLRNRKIHNLISNNKNQLMEYYDLGEYNNKNLSNKHTDNYLNNTNENLYSNNIKDKLYQQGCPFDEYVKNRENNILRGNDTQGNFIPSNISEAYNALNVRGQESYIHRNTFLVSKYDDDKEDTGSYNSDENYYNNDTYDSSYNFDFEKSSNCFNVNDVMLADLEVKIMNNMRNNYYQPNNENNAKEQNDDKYASHELSSKNNTNNNFYFEINNEKYSMDFLVYEKSCFQYYKPCKSYIKNSNTNDIGQSYKECKNGRISSNEILRNFDYFESSHNEYNINRNERNSTNARNGHSNYNYDSKDNVNFLFDDKHIDQKSKIKNKDVPDKKKNINKISDYYINISTNDSLYNIVEYFPKYFYNTIKTLYINMILIYIYAHCLFIITVHGGLNNDFPLYIYFLNKMKKKEKNTVKQKEKSNNSVNAKEENAKITTNKKPEEKNYTSNFLFKPKRIFKRWKQQKKHIKIDLNQNLLKDSNDAKDVKALENNIDPLNSNQKIRETEQILCNESNEIEKHKKNNEKNVNKNETIEHNNDGSKTPKSSSDMKLNIPQKNVSDNKIGTIDNSSQNLEQNKQANICIPFNNEDKSHAAHRSPEKIDSNNNSYNCNGKSNNKLDSALNDTMRDTQDNNNKNDNNDANKNISDANIINQRNNADITDLNKYDNNNKKKINYKKLMGNSSKILKKIDVFHENSHLKDNHKSGMNNQCEKNVDLLNDKIKSPQNQKESTHNDFSNDSYIDNDDEHGDKEKIHDTTDTLNDNPNDVNNENDDNKENKNKIMNIFGKLKDIKEGKITQIKNIYKSEMQKRKNEKTRIKSGFDIIKNKINNKIAKNNINNDSNCSKNEKNNNSQSNIEDEESYNTLNDNYLDDNLSISLYSDNEFLQISNYKKDAPKEKKNNNTDDKKNPINNTSIYMNTKYEVQKRTSIGGILDIDLHFNNNKNSRNRHLRDVTNNIHRVIIYGSDENKIDYKNESNITLSKMRSISLNIKKNSIEKKVMQLEEKIMSRGLRKKSCEISMKISRNITHRSNNIAKEFSKNKIQNNKSVDYIKKISSINYNSNVDNVENDTLSLSYSKELLGLKMKGHKNHSHFSYKCKHLYAINANISYKILKGLQKDDYGLKNIHEKGHFSEYDMAAISKSGGKNDLDYIDNMKNYLKNINKEDIKMKYSNDLNFLKNDKNIQYNSMLYKSISMEKSDDENKNPANDKLNDAEYKTNLLKKKGNNLFDNMKKHFKKFKNKTYLKDKIKQKLTNKQPMLSYDIYKDEKDKIDTYDANALNINNTQTEKSERMPENPQFFKSIIQKNHESFHNFLEQSLYSNNVFKNKISMDLKNELQTLDDYFKNVKNKFKLLSNSNIAYEMLSSITKNEQQKIYSNKIYKRNLSNLELVHNNNWNNLNSRELLKGFTQRNELFYQNWKLKYLSSTISALNLSTIENNIEYLNSLKNFYNYRSLSYYKDRNSHSKFSKGNNLKKRSREYNFFTKKVNKFNKFLLNKRDYYNSIEKSSIRHKLLYGALIFIINYFLFFTILYFYIHDIYNLFKISKYLYLKSKKYDKKKNKDFNNLVKIIYQKNIFSSNANSLYTNKHKNIYMKKNIFAQIFVQNKKENIKMNQKYDQEYSEEEGEFSSDNGHIKKNEFKNNFLPNRNYEENKDKKNILTVYKHAKTNLKIFMHKHMILNLYLEKFLNLFNHKNFNLTKVVISLLVYISILLLPIKFHHLIILKLLHMYYKGYLRRYYKNVIINSILENIRNAKINLKLYKPICSLNDDEYCMLIEEINKGCNMSLNISQFKDIYDEYDLANVIIQNLKEFVESKKIISHEWNINLLNHSPHDNISTINPR